MEVVTTPLQTPISGKGGKTPKTSRLSKSSKSASQSAAGALGECFCLKFCTGVSFFYFRVLLVSDQVSISQQLSSYVCEFLSLCKHSSDCTFIDIIGEKKEVEVSTCLNWQVLLEIMLLQPVQFAMTAL